MQPTGTSTHADDHLELMKLALLEAQKAVPSPTAFCVGCVIVVRPESESPIVLATGYSRELLGNTHAEANALTKAYSLTPEDLATLSPCLGGSDIASLLAQADVYITMEPCSVRTSGLSPCSTALIDAKVRRCIIGVSEPPDFVVCEGADQLKKAGVEIIWLAGLEEQCLAVARREHAQR